MGNCDIEEIMKQLKVLDSLRELRNSMGEDSFVETFPELDGLNSRLDDAITKQEAELQAKMEECGQLSADELPEMPELPELPDIDAELEAPEINLEEI